MWGSSMELLMSGLATLRGIWLSIPMDARLDNTTCGLSPLISDPWLDGWTVKGLDTESPEQARPRGPRHQTTDVCSRAFLLIFPRSCSVRDSSLHRNYLCCITFPLGKARGWLGQPRSKPSIVKTGMRCIDPWYVWSLLWVLCGRKSQNKLCDSCNLKGVKFITSLPCRYILPDPLISPLRLIASPLNSESLFQ